MIKYHAAFDLDYKQPHRSACFTSSVMVMSTASSSGVLENKEPTVSHPKVIYLMGFYFSNI